MKKATQKDIVGLGSQTDPPECLQRPIQAALQYLCDHDTSWSNCMKSLQGGRAFIRELIEFDHTRITRVNLDKMLAFDLSAEEILREEQCEGLYTALAVCVLLESVKNGSKIQFGIPAPPPPCRIEFNSEQPYKVSFRQMISAVEAAQEAQRTPLLICNGKEDIVCTFYSYTTAVVIDAKRIMNEVLIKKTVTLEEMREQVRSKVVSALRYGRPLHIRMANTAMDWHRYCVEGCVPAELFDEAQWKMQAIWTSVLRPGDMDAGVFDMAAHFVLITSDWPADKVTEHLKKALPYYDRMAVIEVDPDSIN